MGIDVKRLMGEVNTEPHSEDRDVELILNLLFQALLKEQPVAVSTPEIADGYAIGIEGHA